MIKVGVSIMHDKEKAIIALEVEVANALMKKWKKTPRDFVGIDKKAHILEYVGKHYEILHLMGIEGIIEDVEDYIANKDVII